MLVTRKTIALFLSCAALSVATVFSANQGSTDKLVEQGDALLGLDRVHDAARVYQQAVHGYPLDWRAHQRLGHAYALMDRLDVAASELQQAAHLNPNDAITHSDLGWVCGMQGKYREAIDEERIAIELNPQRAASYTTLGLALASLGNYEGAINCFNKSLTLDPESVSTYVNLGAALGRQGSYKESIDSFQQALSLDKDSEAAHLGLGVAKAKLGDLNGAIAEYRTAARLAPQSAAAHGKLGWALYQKGDLQGAFMEGIAANSVRFRQYWITFVRTFLTVFAALFIFFGLLFAVIFSGSRFKAQPGEELIRSFFLIFYKDKPGRFVITSRRIVFVPDAFSQWFGGTRLSIERDQIEAVNHHSSMTGGKLSLLSANGTVIHFTMPNLVLDPILVELRKNGIGTGETEIEQKAARSAARKLRETMPPGSPGSAGATEPSADQDEELITVIEYMPDQAQESGSKERGEAH